MRAGNADLWSGLALAALAGYIIVQASGWDYTGPDGPGAGFFPLWYGIAMAALSVALVASSVLRSAPESVDWRGAGRAFAVWLALALSVAAFKLVGFVIGFAALTFFMVVVMYRRPAVVAAVVAVALAAGFYVLFQRLLDVNLPCVWIFCPG
jgi:putative tricarboxylic transport membrane protein